MKELSQLVIFLKFYLFIHKRERGQREGEAGAMQGA